MTGTAITVGQSTNATTTATNQTTDTKQSGAAAKIPTPEEIAATKTAADLTQNINSAYTEVRNWKFMEGKNDPNDPALQREIVRKFSGLGKEAEQQVRALFSADVPSSKSGSESPAETVAVLALTNKKEQMEAAITLNEQMKGAKTAEQRKAILAEYNGDFEKIAVKELAQKINNSEVAYGDVPTPEKPKGRFGRWVDRRKEDMKQIGGDLKELRNNVEGKTGGVLKFRR